MSGTEVILLRSTDTGAPAINGTAGSLIAVLDACLKDGYNSQAIQGITRVGDVATVTFATAHGFAADGLTKVQQAGFDQAEYNGIFQISNVTTLTYDITVTGTPVTPGTGSGTAKAAPLGWEKAFSGTNKGAYRSVEATGTRLFLRVDDNNPNADGGKVTFLRGFEAMSDVDTGTGPFPTTAQRANGLYLTKSTTADAVARSWILAGDGFEFFLFSSTDYGGHEIYNVFHFGDPATELQSDPFGCLIYGSLAYLSNWADTTPSTLINSTITAALNGHYYARNYSQIGGSVPAGKHGNTSVGNIYIGRGYLAYPAPHNNGLYIAPVFASDGAVLRGQLKGIWQPLHTTPLGHGAIVPAGGSPIGRRLLAIATAYSSTTIGETHIDIDGPWR